MELLLLEDITGVGKKNDIVVVGDGFALNCLLPQRRALVATPTVRKRYADAIKRRAMERETERKTQLEAAAALQGKSVTIARKVTKTGKLYAGVSVDDIVSALKDQHMIELKPSLINLPERIKAVGSTSVPVNAGGTSVPLMVIVTKEDAAVYTSSASPSRPVVPLMRP